MRAKECFFSDEVLETKAHEDRKVKLDSMVMMVSDEIVVGSGPRNLLTIMAKANEKVSVDL